MAFPKGKKRPEGAGRKPGTPNKATAEVRAVIALMAQRNIERVESWLLEVDDPAKRVDLFLKLIEYHIPKLGRVEHTGAGGGPVTIEMVTPYDAPPAG